MNNQDSEWKPLGSVLPVGEWTPWFPIRVLDEFPEFSYEGLDFTATQAFICNAQPCIAAWISKHENDEELLCLNPHTIVAFQLTKGHCGQPILRADAIVGAKRRWALGWLVAEDMTHVCVHHLTTALYQVVPDDPSIVTADMKKKMNGIITLKKIANISPNEFDQSLCH